MNKDVKGLLKYLSIIFTIFLMPAGMFYCLLLAYSFSDDGNEILAYTFLILAVVLFLLYFILPVIFTYKAMKNHWSKYLDKFFYNKWLPTILFVLFLFLHIRSDLYEGYIGNLNIFQQIATILSIFIAPAYYLPFIILFIMRKCKLL